MELWTALLLGFAGSLHCAGMCGPLVLAMPAAPGNAMAHLWRKLAYNAGRITTYAGLGLLFGLFGGLLGLAGFQRWISILTGAVILISLAVWPARQTSAWIARPVGWLKLALGRWLARPGALAQFTFGLLNGLLPCGLVYVAALAATAAHHPLAGMQYMLAFGVGTVPMMLGLALLGRSLHFRLHAHLRRLTPVCFGLMAALLILRGLGLGIPYLSPQINSAAPAESSCCHPPG
jgi:hypothetical protein